MKTHLAETDEVFISSIAIGELRFGAAEVDSRYKTTDRGSMTSQATTWFWRVTLQTARRYGEMKERLRARGRPIPENDIWIAAIALQHELTLATRARAL